MLVLITGYLLFDTPIGKPSQMYAAVIRTDPASSQITFALQNGIEVTFTSTQYQKGDKVKLWVKQTRFSHRRVFSLTPNFSQYTSAEQEF